jgi:hypothetical protein
LSAHLVTSGKPIKTTEPRTGSPWDLDFHQLLQSFPLISNSSLHHGNEKLALFNRRGIFLSTTTSNIKRVFLITGSIVGLPAATNHAHIGTIALVFAHSGAPSLSNLPKPDYK